MDFLYRNSVFFYLEWKGIQFVLSIGMCKHKFIIAVWKIVSSLVKKG